MKSVIRQYLWNIFINGLLNSYLIPIFLREKVFNLLGAKIHGSLHAKCIVLSHKLEIGKGSYINRRCLIDNGREWVVVGNNVAIACNVSLLTTNHDYSNETRRGGQFHPSRY